jgi:hypothetical protein
VSDATCQGWEDSTSKAEAFRRWLAAAQAAADAGKDGGFGFGAERVSAGERRMLDQVRAVIGMA